MIYERIVESFKKQLQEIQDGGNDLRGGILDLKLLSTSWLCQGDLHGVEIVEATVVLGAKLWTFHTTIEPLCLEDYKGKPEGKDRLALICDAHRECQRIFDEAEEAQEHCVICKMHIVPTKNERGDTYWYNPDTDPEDRTRHLCTPR